MKAQSGQSGKGDGAPLVAFAWQNSAARSMNVGAQVPNLETDKSHAVHVHLGVRRLTPTECERLQGFPDGWTANQSDSARYRMLGNTVAVPVVEWIARRLVSARG